MTTMQKARIAGRAHWLVIKYLSSTMDVFTTHLCGDPKALVVFSFQEEAEMFLDLRPAAYCRQAHTPVDLPYEDAPRVDVRGYPWSVHLDVVPAPLISRTL